MNKRRTDPIDGILIGVAELSAMTGFTPHQIRSWRKPEFQDKAVFEGLREPNSSSVWYRLVDVEDWREAHGKQSFMRAIPAPNAFRSSRVGTEIDDYNKRTALSTLASINPESVSDAHEKLSLLNRPIVMRYANSVKNRFIEEELGYAPEDAITKDKRFASPVWFTAMTKAMRLAQNEIANLGFTEEEVLAIPVGKVPPLRETKFSS